jgi:hypothetical protein
MKKCMFLLTSVVLCSIFCSFGQVNQNTLLPEIMPSNPQAYQFLKYGEMPVQKYTGTPQINIPIYNIKTKGLDLPITLSYNAAGNKVMEEASWVGLGWNLNTEMQVVQTVIGLDDFGYYKHRLFPNYECLIPTQTGGLTASSVMSLCDGPFFLGFDDNWNQNYPSCYFNPSYYAGLKDTQPDIFYFNALGYSGKFILDWSTNDFVCLTDKRIKIEDPSTSGEDHRPFRFKISVPEGHKFTFELMEETNINVNAASGPNGPVFSYVQVVNEKSSRVYKLKTIVTNLGETVELNYNTTPISKNFPSINLTSRYYEHDSGNMNMNNAGFTTSYLATEQPFSYLSSIIYKDLRVRFLTSERIDLKEALKLDRIEIQRKVNNVVYNTERAFDFDYEYFTSNDEGNNWDNNLNYNNYNSNKTNNEITHRLKLNFFKEEGTNSKPYTFTYNNILLPKKTSYATDYWVQFNGQFENTSFFPNIQRFNLERLNPLYLSNNNKSANEYFAKASILEEITYPTGGKTKYEYELNSFNNHIAPAIDQEEDKYFQISTNNEITI